MEFEKLIIDNYGHKNAVKKILSHMQTDITVNQLTKLCFVIAQLTMDDKYFI